MKDLLVLQNLELHSTASIEAAKQLEAIRSKVPESILETFDRWIDRGKKPVAVVRGGVCCECHLRVAIGVLADLEGGDQLARCGNCGRLLYLPAEEPSRLPTATEHVLVRRNGVSGPRPRAKGQQPRACVRKGRPRRTELTTKRTQLSEHNPSESESAG